MAQLISVISFSAVIVKAQRCTCIFLSTEMRAISLHRHM